MAKRKSPAKKSTAIAKRVTNEATPMQGGALAEAVLGFTPGNFGQQLSQADTMFLSNRWYLVSNMRQLLSEMYVEHGLVQTIIDVPVDDGLRGGIEIQTKQLDEAQITELESAMEEDGDIPTYGMGLKWNRLFGGGGIVIMTDQDPATPLDMDALGPDSKLQFRDVDMWELFWSKQNTSDYSAAIDSNDFENIEYYDYYGIKLHKSRVIKMVGLRAPSFVRPRLRGWGFSVMEATVRSINQYLKANGLTFEILDEAKIDVFKIKGLANSLLRPDGKEQVRKRVEVANKQKNYLNSIALDAEDDYIQKELAFNGISEVFIGIRMAVASDLRMPITKVFGVSAAGFSSGEDDIENYNGMVESQIRSKSKRGLLRMVQIRCQHLFGFVPDDLKISFKPLRILSAEQEENVKDRKFGRVLQARQAGEIDSTEFRESINKDALLPIRLDVEKAEEMEAKQDDEAESLSQKSGKKSSMLAPEAKTAKNSLDDDDEPHIVTVGLVSDDGYVLTGQRKDNGQWASPGGHLDDGEDPQSGAARETLEEVGIHVRRKDFKLIKSERIISHRTGKAFRVTAYIAKVPYRYQPYLSNDPDQEFSVARWVKIDPSTPELKAEARHAKDDFIVEHILKEMK